MVPLLQFYNNRDQMNMEYGHQEVLERKLQQLNQQNHHILQENQYLNETVSSLNDKLQHLSASNLNQSIASIVHHINHHPSNTPLQQLEHQIKSLTFELANYKQINRDLSNLAFEAKQKHNEVLIVQAQNQRQIDQLNHKAEQNAIKQGCHLKRIHYLNDQLHKVNQEKRQLKKERDSFQSLLKQQSKKNIQILRELADSLKVFVSFPDVTQDKNGGNFEELQSVIDLQQEQLGDRNNEIFKLRSVCQGEKRLPEEDNLRNTIKHLKLQMSKYKKAIKDYTLKMCFAEQIITKYSTATSDCQKGLEASARLEEALQEQKQENERLHRDFQEAKSQFIEKNEENSKLKKHLVEIMVQNQAFHHLLFEKFGENHKQMLDRYRQTEKNRFKERTRQQKWCSIQQLIDVNLRLRQRLKI